MRDLRLDPGDILRALMRELEQLDVETICGLDGAESIPVAVLAERCDSEADRLSRPTSGRTSAPRS